jgi:hypothetical protein
MEKLDKTLSPEAKEQFLAVWKERRPEVLEWNDKEILYGMFLGM